MQVLLWGTESGHIPLATIFEGVFADHKLHLLLSCERPSLWPQEAIQSSYPDCLGITASSSARAWFPLGDLSAGLHPALSGHG